MSAFASVSRRTFLKSAALTLAGYALPSWATLEPFSPLVKRVVRTPEGSYFTYPHSNGFLPDGRCVLALPTSGPNNPGLDYLSFDLENGAASMITHVRDARMYYSVAQNGTMLITRKHGVAVLDLNRKRDTPRTIVNDPPWVFHSDCDLSADGKTALVSRARYEEPRAYRMDAIDLASGTVRTLMETDWPIDHAHFSPYDPSWISLCCADAKRNMRMWGWHQQQAPTGRPLFRQILADGKKFDVGHERAMFDRPGLLVVAYGSHSDARPCGLYEVGFDGTVRLVSESNRDLHCNVSRDGRWAVVSLQGTHDRLDLRATRDWIDPVLGYGISDVMVVNLRNGARQFLYRGTHDGARQPFEVQPSISPDGRWVLLKDAREKRVIGVEIDQHALSSFLA